MDDPLGNYRVINFQEELIISFILPIKFEVLSQTSSRIFWGISQFLSSVDTLWWNSDLWSVLHYSNHSKFILLQGGHFFETMKILFQINFGKFSLRISFHQNTDYKIFHFSLFKRQILKNSSTVTRTFRLFSDYFGQVQFPDFSRSGPFTPFTWSKVM